MIKKKVYCYKINLHFLFLTTICHKGGKFLEIRGFFQFFFAGINFCGFNKIEYFAGTNFHIFGQKPSKARNLIPQKISTTKVLTFNCNYFHKKVLDRILNGYVLRAQSGVQMELFPKFVDGFKPLIVGWKECCLGPLAGS